ncbi:MAG: hypothetical protein H0V43_00770 [Gemmatimonadales bacterium]|nr:hypothetical protein [Gemmatimonadales bacterium]
MIPQDEATSQVFSMPQATIGTGHAETRQSDCRAVATEIYRARPWSCSTAIPHSDGSASALGRGGRSVGPGFPARPTRPGVVRG